MIHGRVDGVVGLQRGDEGKGRFVDMLAPDYGAVARFNGGANAGHTILIGDQEMVLHQVPSGIAYPDKINVMGNGVLVDPIRLKVEITEIESAGTNVDQHNLIISDMAHVVMPHHISLDEVREAGDDAQGSTKRGIAYAAQDKAARNGVNLRDIIKKPDQVERKIIEGLYVANQERVLANTQLTDENQLTLHDPEIEAEQWIERVQFIEVYLKDTVRWLKNYLLSGQNVLAEGAQAFMLDLEHGMQPFTTSSYTTMAGAQIGLGLSHKFIGNVTGVVKAVRSHVGGGPFVTEIDDVELASTVRGPLGAVDSERGKSTGRDRRIGHLDLPELRRAIWVNGVDELALTKLDHLRRYGDTILICTQYRDASGNILQEAPALASELAECTPDYEKLPLWAEDEELFLTRTFGDLPREARDYVRFLEKQLEVPIKYIGVGPERSQVIVR